MKRSVFFISDGTGITAEAIGNALLAQFEGFEFEKITMPYVNTPEQAESVVEKINKTFESDRFKPLVFETIVDESVREIIASSNGYLIDPFGTFLTPLAHELGASPVRAVGKSHSINANERAYERRIAAVNFALDNDDGGRVRMYDQADLILIGVSRSGKTPTCLYLALQYGLRAANYPITEEDIEDQALPDALKPFRNKLFGLTIDPHRLSEIRNERKANSRYASLRQCTKEVEEVESMYRRERIPYIDTTRYSIEEIATRILVTTGIDRHLT